MNRRLFLTFSGAAVVAPLIPAWASAPSGKEYWISAQGKKDFGLAWVEKSSGNAIQVYTGFRGHQVIALPGDRVLMVARRPGQQLAVADLASGDLVAQQRCPENRVLVGHACVSPDGKKLFVAEADERDGAGYIGIYRADNLQRISEFSSYGIGPHQLEFMPDRRTMALANGGLHTRAATGKQVLNIDTMESTLVFIDSHSGTLQGVQKLNESKAGMRHLAVSEGGDVVIATQLQRGAMQHNNVVALGAIKRPGEPLQLLQAPQTLWASMKDYAGSVAINSQHQVAGITSPRGNIAAFFSLQRGDLIGYHEFHDVCGITSSANQQNFVLSNSQGQLRVLDAQSLRELPQQRKTIKDCSWDNHLAVLRT